MNLNKAFVLGRVTRDIELKAMPSGDKVANFGIATNRVWKDQSGAKKEDVQFHNITAYGKTAEIVASYVKKGNLLLVEGRIQTRTWDGPDGKKNYRTEIVADNVQLAPKSMGSVEQSGGQRDEATGQDDAPREPKSGGIEYPTEDINPEDIPF